MIKARRTKLAVCAATFTMLAACSGADSAGKDGGKAASKMKPGQYESTMEVVRLEIPGMPAAARDQMQAQMTGSKTTATHCLTKAQADADKGDMIKDIAAQGGQCKMENYSVAGGQVSGKLVCTTATGGKGVMTLTGTKSDTASDMTMIANIEDKAMPQGTAQLEMKVTTRRLGDCSGPQG